MKAPGKFITLEGGEGAGKTTAMSTLEGILANAGIPFVSTREPGGTRLGEQLRSLLLATDGTAIEATSELLMIFAARVQHLAEVITPALRVGRWVLCDRFTDASYAYQGAGRKLDPQLIEALETRLLGSFRPNVTVLLDVPVNVGLARARGRGALDRFELEEMDFFERVRETYLKRAKTYSSRFRVIDAQQSPDQVAAALHTIVQELLVEAGSSR